MTAQETRPEPAADPADTRRRRTAPARIPVRRLALRVVLAIWLAFLLLGSLGDLLGIPALVEFTDYRALFLR